MIIELNFLKILSLKNGNYYYKKMKKSNWTFNTQERGENDAALQFVSPYNFFSSSFALINNYTVLYAPLCFSLFGWNKCGAKV